MTDSIIWLHPECLRPDHPVFNAAPADAQVLFVWDDAWLRDQNMSLKRLVFLYEAVCGLPATILAGETIATIKALQPKAIYTVPARHPAIQDLTHNLEVIAPVTQVSDAYFADAPTGQRFRRFFKYWNSIKKEALQPNGGRACPGV